MPHAACALPSTGAARHLLRNEKEIWRTSLRDFYGNPMTRTPSPTQRGFTLLEVMVVMLIIGLLLGFMTLSISTGGAARQAEEEARRLAALIDLARQEAVLRTQEMAIEFRPDSYRFLQLAEGNTWLAVEADKLLRPRELPADIALGLLLEGEAVRLNAKPEETTPHVFLLSNGESSPFELTLATPDEGVVWRVAAAEDTAVTVEPVSHGR